MVLEWALLRWHLTPITGNIPLLGGIRRKALASQTWISVQGIDCTVSIVARISWLNSITDEMSAVLHKTLLRAILRLV